MCSISVCRSKPYKTCDTCGSCASIVPMAQTASADCRWGGAPSRSPRHLHRQIQRLQSPWEPGCHRYWLWNVGTGVCRHSGAYGQARACFGAAWQDRRWHAHIRSGCRQLHVWFRTALLRSWECPAPATLHGNRESPSRLWSDGNPQQRRYVTWTATVFALHAFCIQEGAPGKRLSTNESVHASQIIGPLFNFCFNFLVQVRSRTSLYMWEMIPHSRSSCGKNIFRILRRGITSRKHVLGLIIHVLVTCSCATAFKNM